MGSLFDLFNSQGFEPHGFCLLWEPGLIRLHIAADAVIGISYYLIPLGLAYFVWKRDDIDFGWIFWMFAAFILACGTTHWFEIWTLWHPDYAIQGLLKAVTAGVSFATAVMLVPLLPRAIALPSPAQLRLINQELSTQIAERNDAMAALQREMAERQRTEEALRQSQKLETLGQLTGGVAHDFNNLLHIITGNLHALRQICGADAVPHLDALEWTLDRGESLTRQLLTFGRRQMLQPRVVDLGQQLATAVTLLSHTLPSDLDLRLDVAAEVSPVEIDPNEFEVALINLAVNARDAMPNGGRLTIDIRNEVLDGDDPRTEGLAGAFVRIAVTDTGVGIAADNMLRVFEPFFTTKGADKGTGLGLSQVYGFAKQSGGTVTLESAVGRGTTVALHLPRTRGAT